MADRKVHYEAAFEEFLRGRAVPYVAVDEAKRALFARTTLKSFDFVVYSPQGTNLLVDVKGRSAQSAGAMQTWVTDQDVADLTQWETVFGGGFVGVFAFVYWVDAPLIPDSQVYEFRDRAYRMLGIELADYRNRMRRRSAKWGTVSIPAEDFRSLARPIEQWL